jgi:hypothetical protein
MSQHQAKAVICCLISSNSWFNFWILGLCTAEDTEGKIDYGHLWGWNHLTSLFILLQERQTSQKTPWMWHFFWRGCFLLSLTPMLHGLPTCGRKFNFQSCQFLKQAVEESEADDRWKSQTSIILRLFLVLTDWQVPHWCCAGGVAYFPKPAWYDIQCIYIYCDDIMCLRQLLQLRPAVLSDEFFTHSLSRVVLFFACFCPGNTKSIYGWLQVYCIQKMPHDQKEDGHRWTFSPRCPIKGPKCCNSCDTQLSRLPNSICSSTSCAKLLCGSFEDKVGIMSRRACLAESGIMLHFTERPCLPVLSKVMDRVVHTNVTFGH